eukprot:scaffold2044_cov202-Prasinococcus_capsulatus_cf.AAC.5
MVAFNATIMRAQRALGARTVGEGYAQGVTPADRVRRGVAHANAARAGRRRGQTRQRQRSDDEHKEEDAVVQQASHVGRSLLYEGGVTLSPAAGTTLRAPTGPREATSATKRPRAARLCAHACTCASSASWRRWPRVAARAACLNFVPLIGRGRTQPRALVAACERGERAAGWSVGRVRSRGDRVLAAPAPATRKERGGGGRQTTRKRRWLPPPPQPPLLLWCGGAAVGARLEPSSARGTKREAWALLLLVGRSAALGWVRRSCVRVFVNATTRLSKTARRVARFVCAGLVWVVRSRPTFGRRCVGCVAQVACRASPSLQPAQHGAVTAANYRSPPPRKQTRGPHQQQQRRRQTRALCPRRRQRFDCQSCGRCSRAILLQRAQHSRLCMKSRSGHGSTRKLSLSRAR